MHEAPTNARTGTSSSQVAHVEVRPVNLGPHLSLVLADAQHQLGRSVLHDIYMLSVSMKLLLENHTMLLGACEKVAELATLLNRAPPQIVQPTLPRLGSAI